MGLVKEELKVRADGQEAKEELKVKAGGLVKEELKVRADDQEVKEELKVRVGDQAKPGRAQEGANRRQGKTNYLLN